MICCHGHQQKFKYPYPRDSKIIQMPYPWAKAINQNPALCPASPPPRRLDIDKCIMCPVTVQWLRTPANVEALRQFPFLDSNDVINDLITELPNYLAVAQDVIMSCEEDKVKWWRQQSDNRPHWSSAVMKVLLA